MGFADLGGNQGDLKRASISEYDPTDASWKLLRQNYYRYYVAEEEGGFEHGLKYEVSPEGYAQMVGAGINPDNASDEVIEAYSTKYFKYDEDRRVVVEKVRGGQETYTLSYTPNPDEPGFEDYNTWNTKTVETQPGGNTNTVYTNRAGVPILSIFEETAAEEPRKWYSYQEFNVAGRPTLMATSAAVESVVEPSGGSTTLTVNLKSSVGLIQTNNYYTATNPSLGEVATYLKNKGVKRGESGSEVILNRFEYDTHTVDGVSIHPPSAQIRYPVAGEPGNEVSFHYCYYWSNGTPGYMGYLPINPDNSGNVNSLIVVEQGRTEYDNGSNTILSTGWLRFHDATGEGPLNGPNDAQPKARRIYGATWFDGINRSIASATYGTNVSA